MELFTPEIGLIFWMFVSFAVVFFLLAKFGFPIILKMVEKRSDFIDNSIKSAKEANERLAGIKEEAEKLLSDARVEQLRILNEAGQIRNKMVEDAKTQAKNEAVLLIEKATADIVKAKEDALAEIRGEVAVLSIEIAEKVLRQELENKTQQTDIINRLLDEMYV
ncbi:MAG: F0F1 ATP synthase subunit B [Prevotellaceae bacterium]|jgi:F-type H+-transporting ATPase subunit b|nr:F0F1 ATP synthase subunit B [Prevotellaceae bacterium]